MGVYWNVVFKGVVVVLCETPHVKDELGVFDKSVKINFGTKREFEQHEIHVTVHVLLICFNPKIVVNDLCI